MVPRAAAWSPAFLCLVACAAQLATATPDTKTASAQPPASVASTAPNPRPRPPVPAHVQADAWRAAHRLIDLHMHIDPTPEHLATAVRVMDAAGIGVAVNLSGGTVTHAAGQHSELEQTKASFDADPQAHGRFLQYMNLDYAGWDAADFAQRAVAQVEEGARLGAAGFKEFKRLGLFLRDAAGRLIHIDDPRLDPMWHRLGELGMPVSIHVADPKAFWGPYDATNERWKELRDHPAGGSATRPNIRPAKSSSRPSSASSSATRRRPSFACTLPTTRRTSTGSTPSSTNTPT
jgi:hypothetical protein